MAKPWSAQLNHLLHGAALILLTGTVTAMPFATATGVAEERSLDTRQTLRARQALLDGHLVTPEEDRVVRRVLNAAALTYVAATLTSILTLLYFLFRAGLIGNRSE